MWWYNYQLIIYILNSELRGSNIVLIDIIENYIEDYNKVIIQK